MIVTLLIAMAIVLVAELIYIFVKKKRRKEEMSLFRSREPAGEPLADRAYNSVLTTESISQTLAGQGADTSEADGLVAEAKRALAGKDYARAIERAEAAKISLLRAKREMDAEQQPRTVEADIDDEEPERPEIQEKKDGLPPNYMQAKFMLGSTKDLLENRGITDGEAHDLYSTGMKLFDSGDYTSALSCAVKASLLLNSETVTLIGREKPPQAADVEVLVCPSCDGEIKEDDAFCRECGQNLAAPTECPGCGNEIGPSDKFCRKCGTKLSH